MKDLKEIPIGIVPLDVWLDIMFTERLKEIDSAIDRYCKAKKAVPFEWIEEREDLIRHLYKK
ncbi:MAG: hypothetical protein ACRDB0_06855 [Paraclostridium sp.]